MAWWGWRGGRGGWRRGWIGPWPGRGPFSHLPPWQRPGWLFGPGSCRWLFGWWYPYWWYPAPTYWPPYPMYQLYYPYYPYYPPYW